MKYVRVEVVGNEDRLEAPGHWSRSYLWCPHFREGNGRRIIIPSHRLKPHNKFLFQASFSRALIRRPLPEAYFGFRPTAVSFDLIPVYKNGQLAARHSSVSRHRPSHNLRLKHADFRP